MTRSLRTELPSTLDTLGQRIRHARISAGLAQPRLAALVSRETGTRASTATVSKWECDGVKNPNNATLLAVEQATGFSFKRLVTGQGSQRVPLAPQSPGDAIGGVTEREVEAACRAMWASWGRMRPDHERKHRADVRRGLEAAAAVR